MECNALTDGDGCFGSSTVNIPNITQNGIIKAIRQVSINRTAVADF